MAGRFRDTPRKTARDQGLKTYKSMKPCRHGHMAERLVCNGTCTECTFPSDAKMREYNSAYRSRHDGRSQQIKYRFRYGIELDTIRPKPDCCEVCEKPHRKIVFDHCHDTGAFRGWLCDPCNIVLGMVKDDADTLDKLAEHLRKPKTSSIVNLLRAETIAQGRRLRSTE